MILRQIKTVSNSELSSRQKKIVLLTSLGSLIEYYDFFVSILMVHHLVVVIFQMQITSDLAPVLIVAIIFSGYLFRILGVYCYNRWYKNLSFIHSSLINSLLISFSLVAIACIPCGQMLLGILVLITSRIIIGFARGAESQLEFTYLFYHLYEKRGIALFGLLAGAEGGVLLALGVNNLILHVFSELQMDSFGWRVPFLIGGGCQLLIWFLQKCFNRTDATILQCQRIVSVYSLLQILPKQVVISSLLSGFRASVSWLMILLIPLLLSYQNYSRESIGNLMLIGSLCGSIGSILVLRYISFTNSTKMLSLVVYCFILSLPIFYWGITIHRFVFLSIITIGFTSGAVSVLVLRVIFRLFPVRNRLSGVVYCYGFGHTQISSGIFLIILAVTGSLRVTYLNSLPRNVIFLYVTILAMLCLCTMVLIVNRNIAALTIHKLD